MKLQGIVGEGWPSILLVAAPNEWGEVIDCFVPKRNNTRTLKLLDSSW